MPQEAHLHTILPNIRPNLEAYRHLPLFFLAGPILGGDDWHVTMAAQLEQAAGDCIIVNPSRYDAGHPHTRCQLQGPQGFERQVSWERYYLRQAASEWPAGCVIFWLPSESKVKPREDGKPYAMDTRGEIGEWRGRMMLDPTIRMVMGARPDFPGLNTIAQNFAEALGERRFTIHGSMQDVVKAAAKFAKAENSFERRVSR